MATSACSDDDPAIVEADEPGTIVDVAVDGGFNTLVAAVQAAGLAETLQSDGPFTVFAPTDEAFAKLPEGTVASLLLPENKAKLVQILTLHVVSGRIYSDQALEAGAAKTLEGTSVAIKAKDGAATVGTAKLVKTDIESGNGVIHVIDSVILPDVRVSKRATNSPARFK